MEEKVQMKTAFEAEIIKTQLEVQEQTMQTIGADLHDNIGQLLSLTSLTLKSIELDDPAKVQQKIDAAVDLTSRSIKEMRLLGKLLQGEHLIALGLPEAIRHEVDWLERSGQFQITYTTDDDLPQGNTDQNLIVFRILQEVLNNIIKHAQASRIDISLSTVDEQLRLVVSDNGIGFDINTLTDGQLGLGLHNIQKRAAIVGGRAEIESQPGSGTRIAIYIPYL